MALTDNLISYWKLDGNSNDSVGGNNGTDTSVTYSTGNGKINEGGGFNGNSSQISIPNSSNLNIVNDLTISVWINPGVQSNTYSAFIEKHYAQSYYFGYGGGRTVALYYGGSQIVTSSDIITDGIWQQIAVTYNRASQIGKIYKNGTVQQTFTGFNPTVSGGTTNVYIGRQQTASRWYNGKLDELGVWNRTLSDQEISELYNNGNGIQYPFSTEILNPEILLKFL